MNNNGKYIKCLAIFNTNNIHEQIILKNKQGMRLYEQQLRDNTLIIRSAHNTRPSLDENLECYSTHIFTKYHTKTQ